MLLQKQHNSGYELEDRLDCPADTVDCSEIRYLVHIIKYMHSLEILGGIP